MTHKIEPLKIEEYIEHVRYPDHTLDYEELNYEKAVRATIAKVNDLIAHSKEQDEVIYKLEEKEE